MTMSKLLLLAGAVLVDAGRGASSRTGIGTSAPVQNACLIEGGGL